MKKNYCFIREWKIPELIKLLRVMKLTIILCLLSVVSVLANKTYSQIKTLKLSMKDASVKEVLNSIEEQSEFYFMYSEKVIDVNRKVDVNIKNQKVVETLNLLFEGTDVEYTVNDRIIVLTTPEVYKANSERGIQQNSITGSVTDEGGQPLPGVTVVIKGTTQGTVTNTDGSYTVSNIPDNATLQFSFVGMLTQEVVVGSQTTINVEMVVDAIGIEEVVAIGYGVQRKMDLTTSVSNITNDDIEKKSMANLSQALQGKAAGVRVVQMSGKPSGDFSIQIRGATSINAGNEPLYVVDGIPTNSISGINPVDIESIQVLKDASSSAIYGARGANGVVLINTKKGEANKPRVSFRSVRSVSKVAKMLDLLNAKQNAELLNDEKVNAGMAPIIDPNTITTDIDWQDEIFFMGQTSDSQLSFSGGNENTQFYLSTSYLDSEGITKPSSYNRYSFKLNLDHKMYDWLTLGTNINVNKSKGSDIIETNSERNEGLLLTALAYSTPYTPKYKPNGDFGSNPHQGGWNNPYFFMYGSNASTRKSGLLGMAFAKINFTQNLSFKSSFSVDTYYQNYDQFDLQEHSEYNRSLGGNAYANSAQQFIWLNENILDYKYSVDKHDITALAGVTRQNSRLESSLMNKQGFPDDKVQTLNAAASIVDASTDATEWSLQSYLFRVTYAYDNKYLFTANFRADGSSKFGKNNKYGYFPSASAGWRVSEENFFSGIDAVNDLKLRVSHGLTGNQNAIGNYSHLGLIGLGQVYPFAGSIYPGSAPSTIPNPDLKWETTKQTDIGLDLSLFQSRITVAADAYFKSTSDLLLRVNLPRSTGYSSAIQNIGKITNNGFEFELNTRNTTGQLKWNTNLNFSLNRNKVVDIGGADKIIYTAGIIRERGNVTIIKEGEPLSVFYGYVSEGVDPQTGMLIYQQENPNDDIPYNPDTDKTIIGNPNPKFIYGITNSFSYKNFSLSIFLQGIYGNDIFNGTRLMIESMEQVTNASAATLRRWKNPGDITDIPKAIFGNSNNSQISSRFVEKGSYLRVKDVTLSYNLEADWLKTIHVSGINVFLSAQNLLTFTKYSGYDPEVSWDGNVGSKIDNSISMGVDYGTYPNVRTYNFGFTLDF